MALADTQELAVKLDLKGNFKRELANAQTSFKNFDKATSRTQKSLGKFGSNIGKGVAIGLGVTATAFLAVTKAASDYESAFAGVRKTVSETAKTSFAELSAQLREMSKQLPISAADLARLAEAGGALGVPTDNLKEFVRVTALLGETTNVTADEAATSLGVLGNVLHLTSDDYSRFASSLVALGNAGASTESDILQIAQRAGAAGKLIGLTTQEILGFSSSIASLGIEAEAGGTAFQNFAIASSKAILGGGKDLKEFAKIAGVSAKTFQKAFKQDAGKALQQFLAGLGKLDQASQLKALEDLGFTDSRITRTLLGLANNTALVADQMGVANTAYAENTALTKEAEQRNKTFASQLAITKNVLTDIAITIGSKLLPKLTPLLTKFNEFVNANQGGIEKFGDDLAGTVGRIADAIGKTDWTPFIDGLKLSASLAKGAFDAFNSLPDDFKKLILVGAGVNKITGGLLTSLGKDLLAGLGSQFLSRGSSPANPLFVTQVGGTPGPSGPGGAAPLAGLGLAGGVTLGIGAAIIGGLQAGAADFAGKIAGPIGEAVQKNVGGGPTNIFGPLSRLADALQGDLRSPLEKISTNTFNVGTYSAASATANREAAARANVTNERLEAIRGQEAASHAALITTSAGETAAINAAKAAQVAAVAKAGSDTRSETAAVRRAVEAKKLNVDVKVVNQNKVSVQQIVKQTSIVNKYTTIS